MLDARNTDAMVRRTKSEVSRAWAAALVLLRVISIAAFFAIAVCAQSVVHAQSLSAGRFEQAMAAGSIALQGGDNASAEQAFRQAVDIDPQSLPALNDLAISLARQQREDEAIALYEKALRLKPNDAVTQRNLGVAYFRAQHYRQALPLLAQTATQTHSFQAYSLYGFDLFALNRYQEAARQLKIAHALQPDDLETLDMLGKAYMRDGNYGGVTDVFTQIMTVNPNSPEAHAMMAMAYDKLYRESDAIREYQAALAANPAYPGIHTGLGVIYWRNDNPVAAEHEFRTELARYPSDPVANCTLGRILVQANKPAEAVTYLQAVLKVNPKYSDALLALGQAELALHRLDQAVPALQRAVAIDPGSAQAHYLLGSAYNQAGRPADGTRERRISQALHANQSANKPLQH